LKFGIKPTAINIDRLYFKPARPPRRAEGVPPARRPAHASVTMSHRQGPLVLQMAPSG